MLSGAYPATAPYNYSRDKNEKIIQKAVLYHRIRKNESLSTGMKSMENDAAYDKLAKNVTEWRDPVVKFIKGREPKEQAELLEHLMVADKNSPWFEKMVTKSAEKSAEASVLAAVPENAGIQQKAAGRVGAAKSMLQAELFQSLAHNRKSSTTEFFKNRVNAENARRLLAIELHNKLIEKETEDLKRAYSYESPENQEKLMKERPPFSFEKDAAENFEKHIRRLENTQEVLSALQNLSRTGNLEELGNILDNPPSPEYIHRHENLELMEEKLIPDAVKAFLSGPDAPKEGSSLDKSFLELLDEKKQKFPSDPKPEDCNARIKKYKNLIKKIDKTELADSVEWQKLKKELNDQISRLDDVATAPDREKVGFSYRADTLIDYYDPKDPTHTPMDAMQAREKLIRGEKLEQVTFSGDDFAGTVQDVTYDKKTGLINKGPEKLITRVMNLSEKAGRKPELQLEELRKIKEVLKKSDPFYVKNSEGFKNVMDSLNNVIKAQESLDKDANVRQVAELRQLYAELDSNAAKYVKDKGDRLKTGDDRAQIRIDAIKTLQSLTGEKHVGKVALGLYSEQKKLDVQQKMAEPCMKIMNKWKKAGNPKTPEEFKNFKKDFEALSSRFDMIEKNYGDVPYFKMNIAENLEQFTQQAEEVQQKLEPDDKLNLMQMQNMKKLALEGNDEIKKLSAMDGTIPTEKKSEVKKKENTKENNKSEIVKDPLKR